MTTLNSKLFSFNMFNSTLTVKGASAAYCLPEGQEGRNGNSDHDILFKPSFHIDIIKNKR